ncbi:N-6 DNA methylase [Streptomyces fradiae]|uniref:SAM-dependent methyltransferase n=2 Tax=Streptomyces TaxID=1883 RepID=A0A3R7FQ07_9ACTN|nr:N-6 DNA methylase [Streptomyces fradiae]OFA52398.1 N-6 DNA methylase [Streptomyces fradiae]PQM21132.1 SAM-dependent methyltransferase [Streptomyces xinghaiensis]RKM92954.1 SAM-dependent methyltransferase [Streptomyces xinghaiensis]RNC72580.1 SAM-dependent methyltransferase [Streptomyces xinghaiensis]
MTAAEISRIAGVTRATVSNWRRRHGDFPAPSGGTDSSPLYDLEEVRGWLASRGQHTAATPSGELRTLLRLREPAGVGTSDLLLLVLAAARRPAELTGLLALADADLVKQANDAAAEVADVVPDTEPVRFTTADTAVLRALLLCVRDEGAQTALSVLAERELEDSAASGAYRTPEPLANLLALLLPGTPARVLDPACGSGALLAAAARRGARELYGQDALPVQARRSAVSLLLAAPEAAVTVRAGDSLRTDAFPGLAADAVLCNPPYGDRDWGHDELAYDPRWAYGVPPRAEPELAWAQHALAHLTPGGHSVLLLPPAVASRASGRRVRAELVRGGALRAVIALPPGASVPLHIGLQIWVLQRPEPGGPERKSVLFVDTASDAASGTGPGAATGTAAGTASGTAPGTAPAAGRGGTAPASHTRSGSRSATVDWARITERALGAWRAFTESPDTFEGEPGVAHAAGVLDLLDDQVDLTPARLVRASRAGLAPAALAAETGAARRHLAEAAKSLARTAGYEDWSPAGATAREWRTATASDLARGGALTLLRTAPDAARGRTDSGTGGSGGTGAPEARPVLTAPDIAAGSGPTGDPAGLRGGATAPVIATGDVLVRAVAGGGGPMARVAGEEDAGALLGPHVHLFRPDPARLDAWFLAGFLGAEENIAGASTGSTVLAVNPGRLRVPLLPLEEQRRYGEAFRHVHELRAEARRADRLAEETARLLSGGLTGGQLLPGGGPSRGRDTTAGDVPHKTRSRGSQSAR